MDSWETVSQHGVVGKLTDAIDVVLVDVNRELASTVADMIQVMRFTECQGRLHSVVQEADVAHALSRNPIVDLLWDFPVVECKQLVAHDVHRRTQDVQVDDHVVAPAVVEVEEDGALIKEADATTFETMQVPRIVDFVL